MPNLMNRFRTIVTLFLALAALCGVNSGLAAGLTADFSGPLDPNWNSDNQYAISQEDGRAQIRTNKTVSWAGFTYNFDSPLDISANPVVNLVMRSEPGLILTLYLADGSGSINLAYPVYASST